MGKYDDIINLPHHVSVKHPQMPRENRAAQFAPFAALTGHDAAIRETARLTTERIVLDVDAVAELDAKLQVLGEQIAQRPEVAITHFQPDAKKAGGTYITTVGTMKKLDDISRAIVFTDGTQIEMEDILDIDSTLLGDVL